MAYCNGKVVDSIDYKGAEIIHVLDTEGASGQGHSAWIIGNDNDGYVAYDYQANGSSGSGGSESSSERSTRRQGGFSTPEEALNFLNSNREGENKFDKGQKWETTSEQDVMTIDSADNYITENYSLLFHNCYQLGYRVLRLIGIPVDPGPRPNGAFNNNGQRGAVNWNVVRE